MKHLVFVFFAVLLAVTSALVPAPSWLPKIDITGGGPIGLNTTEAADLAADTVDSSTTDNAVSSSNQRQTFYGASRFWVFYDNGTDLVYKSSLDGDTWSSVTVLVAGLTHSKNFSLWWDSTYVHFVYSTGTSNADLHYRRGLPDEDGVITLGAEQNAVAADASKTYLYPFISKDTAGYPVVSYTVDNTTDTTPYVVKANQNDGTWTTDNFSTQLTTDNYPTWVTSILPVSDNDCIAIYARDGSTVRSKVYDYSGSTFLTENATTSAIEVGSYFSAVVTSDNVCHMVFLGDTSENITYTHYHSGGTAWQTEEVVYAAASATSAPVLSKTLDDNLYCFWMGDPIADHIYYKAQVSGVWDTAAEDWLTEIDITANDRLNCAYEQTSTNYIPVVWLVDDGANYDVRFGAVEVATIPDPIVPAALPTDISAWTELDSGTAITRTDYRAYFTLGRTTDDYVGKDYTANYFTGDWTFDFTAELEAFTSATAHSVAIWGLANELSNHWGYQHDDFEWGVDGNTITTAHDSTPEHNVTWSETSPDTSSVEIDDTVKNGGTRSMLLKHAGAGYPYCSIPLTAADSMYEINFDLRKDDASKFVFSHGNGTHRIYLMVLATEVIWYANHAGVDTNSFVTFSKDVFHTISIRNINFTAGTYDVWVDSVLSGTLTGIPMFHNPDDDDVVRFYNTAGASSLWIDNLSISTRSDSLAVYMRGTTASPTIVLSKTEAGVESVDSWTIPNRWRYRPLHFTVHVDPGTSITCEIYGSSDRSAGSLLDTLSIVLTESNDFQYLYLLASHNNGNTGYSATGYSGELYMAAGLMSTAPAYFAEDRLNIFIHGEDTDDFDDFDSVTDIWTLTEPAGTTVEKATPADESGDWAHFTDNAGVGGAGATMTPSTEAPVSMTGIKVLYPNNLANATTFATGKYSVFFSIEDVSLTTWATAYIYRDGASYYWRVYCKGNSSLQTKYVMTLGKCYEVVIAAVQLYSSGMTVAESRRNVQLWVHSPAGTNHDSAYAEWTLVDSVYGGWADALDWDSVGIGNAYSTHANWTFGDRYITTFQYQPYETMSMWDIICGGTDESVIILPIQQKLGHTSPIGKELWKSIDGGQNWTWLRELVSPEIGLPFWDDVNDRWFLINSIYDDDYEGDCRIYTVAEDNVNDPEYNPDNMTEIIAVEIPLNTKAHHHDFYSYFMPRWKTVETIGGDEYITGIITMGNDTQLYYTTGAVDHWLDFARINLDAADNVATSSAPLYYSGDIGGYGTVNEAQIWRDPTDGHFRALIRLDQAVPTWEIAQALMESLDAQGAANEGCNQETGNATSFSSGKLVDNTTDFTASNGVSRFGTVEVGWSVWNTTTNKRANVTGVSATELTLGDTGDGANIFPDAGSGAQNDAYVISCWTMPSIVTELNRKEAFFNSFYFAGNLYSQCADRMAATAPWSSGWPTATTAMVPACLMKMSATDATIIAERQWDTFGGNDSPGSTVWETGNGGIDAASAPGSHHLFYISNLGIAVFRRLDAIDSLDDSLDISVSPDTWTEFYKESTGTHTHNLRKNTWYSSDNDNNKDYFTLSNDGTAVIDILISSSDNWTGAGVTWHVSPTGDPGDHTIGLWAGLDSDSGYVILVKPDDPANFLLTALAASAHDHFGLKVFTCTSNGGNVSMSGTVTLTAVVHT